MRWVVAIVGLTATAGLLFVSALMNWRFGFTLGKSELDAHIYAGASVAADLFKAVLPFVVYWLARHRHFIPSFVAGLLLAITVVYSLTSAAGFAALNRAATADSRGQSAEIYASLQGRLRQTRNSLEKLPDSRTVATVQAKIDNARDHARWKSTKKCTDATIKESKTFCADYRDLVAELATAKKRGTLEARRDTLQDKLDSTPRVTAAADPQADMLAKMTGVDIAKVQIGLILLVTALLEVGSGFGAFVTLAFFHALAPKQTGRAGKGQKSAASTPQEPLEPPKEETGDNTPTEQKTAPAPTSGDLTPQLVKNFAAEHVTSAPAETLPAGALYKQFRAWCKGRKIAPPSQTAFGRSMAALGFEKLKKSGRVIYQDIQITALATG